MSFLKCQGGPYSRALQGPFTQLSSCMAGQSLPELGHDFRGLLLPRASSVTASPCHLLPRGEKARALPRNRYAPPTLPSWSPLWRPSTSSRVEPRGQDVDARDKPEHDGKGNRDAPSLLPDGRRWRGAPDEGLPVLQRTVAVPHPCPSPNREKGPPRLSIEGQPDQGPISVMNTFWTICHLLSTFRKESRSVK